MYFPGLFRPGWEGLNPSRVCTDYHLSVQLGWTSAGQLTNTLSPWNSHDLVLLLQKVGKLLGSASILLQE